MLIAVIDNTDTAHALQAQLARLGVAGVKIFPSVEDATRPAYHTTPDCVLLNAALSGATESSPPRERLYRALQVPVISYGTNGQESFPMDAADPASPEITLPVDDRSLMLAIDRACRRQGVLDQASELKERTDALISLCSDGVIVLMPDFTVASVNSQAYVLLGREPDFDDVGRSVFALCPAADPEQEHALLQDLASHASPKRRMYRCRKTDGTVLTLDLSSAGMHDAFGNVTSWMFVFRVDQGSAHTAATRRAAASSPAAASMHAPRMDSVFSSMIDDIRRLVPRTDRGRLFLYNPTLDNVSLVGKYGYSDERIQRSSELITHGYLRAAARHSKGILIVDAHHPSVERYHGEIEELRAVRSAIAVPFSLHDQMTGLLVLESPEVGAFSDKDLEIATMYIGHVSLTMRKDPRATAPASPQDHRPPTEQRRAGMFRATLDGVLLACDDIYARLLGYESPQELVGLDRYLFYLEKSLQNSEERLLPGGHTVMHDELQMTLKDGSTGWYLETSIIVYDKRLHTQVVEGSLIDIDHQARQREGITWSGDQYLDMLDAFPVPVWRCDTTGKRDFANAAWEEFTGIAKGNACSLFHTDLIHPDDLRAYMETVFTGLERGEPIESEYRLHHFSGEYRTVVEYCHPLFNHDHQFVGYVGVAIDHTHPTHLMDELLKVRAQLERSDHAKTSFLTTISHEIRTPLNIVLGFADLLHAAMQDRMTDEERQHFEFIHAGGQRLLRTFDHILEYSKLQSGAYATRMTLINAADHVKKVCGAYRHQANAKGLRLEEMYPDTPLFMVADTVMLTHALDNLIDNAIKFSSAGTVTVRVSRESSEVVIDVIDEGIGISEEYRQHVFEICTQEESGYSRPFEGAGLGLALTRTYVNLNRGTIAFDTEKGVGTRMELRFPIADQADHRAPKPLRRFPDPSPRRTVKDVAHVLVAEDDPQNQQFMKAVLQSDYHVHLAANGNEVWRIATTQSIDIIIMDLSLRGSQDGLQLTRRIRAHTTTKDIPIIALTAHTLPEDKRRCLEAGCNIFQPKPVSVKDLKRHLADLLSLTAPRVPVG